MHHRFSSEELQRLLHIATAVADREDCPPAAAIEHIERTVLSDDAGLRPPRPLHEYADGLRRARSRREEMLGGARFRDPSWDMLLDLYVARCRGELLTVGALCTGSGVPTTTAVRHVERLDALGHLRRFPDPSDNRRVVVELAEGSVVPLETVLSRMQRCA